MPDTAESDPALRVEPETAGPGCAPLLPGAIARFEGWIQAHPVLAAACLMFAAAAVAVGGLSYWPGPVPTNGGDPLGIQTVMALSYDSGPLRWISGPSIDERTYRPLCMLLHWLEFRLWGTQEVYYLWVSTVVHVGNAALLALLTATLARGRPIIRGALGFLAGLYFAGSTYQNRVVINSILTFWPSQSDAFALLFALIGLLLLARYLRFGRRLALAGCILALTCAVLFKEIAYIALFVGIGLAVLPPFGSNPRPRWTAAILFAACGVGLWELRTAVLGGTLYAPPANISRMLRQIAPFGYSWELSLTWPIWTSLLVLAAAAIARVKFQQGPAPLLAGAAALLIGGSLLSPDWRLLLLEETYTVLFWAAIFWIGFWAWIAGAARDRAIRILAVCWLLSCYIVSPYRAVFGWYGYWPQALGAMVEALSIPFALGILGWLAAARAPEVPSSGAPQAVVSVVPASRGQSSLRFALAIAGTLIVLVGSARGVQRSSLSLRQWSVLDGRWRVEWTSPQVSAAESAPCIVVLPGRDYPALWDRRDPKTSVTSGLARLGYRVCVIQPVSGERGNLPTARDVRSWMERRSWPHSGVLVMGWSEGGPAALELAWEQTAGDDRTIPLKGAAVFLDHGSAEALGRDFAVGAVWQRNRSTGSATNDRTQTDWPPIYAAFQPRDRQPLQPVLRFLQSESTTGRRSVTEFMPLNPGPVFPREPNHWKRSLDLGIDFLVRAARPPQIP